VKANLLFFTRGGPTEKVWYYDLSDVKVTKKKPLTADRFEEFLRLLPAREDSERSWSVTRAELKERGHDLKAVNPNRKREEDTRTPGQLLDSIEAAGREVAETVERLRNLTAGKRNP
jgi:type I restriction enzyme M protein